MYYDIEKQAKKIRNKELAIKITYIFNGILGLILGLIIKRILFNNILIVLLFVFGGLYEASLYAKRENEKIDRMKWEIDMYNKTEK